MVSRHRRYFPEIYSGTAEDAENRELSWCQLCRHFMTTCGDTSDDKDGIITTLGFQWEYWNISVSYLEQSSRKSRPYSLSLTTTCLKRPPNSVGVIDRFHSMSYEGRIITRTSDKITDAKLYSASIHGLSQCWLIVNSLRPRQNGRRIWSNAG